MFPSWAKEDKSSRTVLRSVTASECVLQARQHKSIRHQTIYLIVYYKCRAVILKEPETEIQMGTKIIMNSLFHFFRTFSSRKLSEFTSRTGCFSSQFPRFSSFLLVRSAITVKWRCVSQAKIGIKIFRSHQFPPNCEAT